MHKPSRHVAGLASILGLALLSTPNIATAATIAPPVVLSQGHVDVIDVGYENGALELSVHDESVVPDVERSPSSVVFEVKRAARIGVPADPSYGFLGTPGAVVSILPQTENSQLLWPGMATEEVPAGVFVNDAIDIKFTRFQGPNGVSVFNENPDGTAAVLADSEDAQPDVIRLIAGDHAHSNIAFESRGTYRITYVATGVLASTGATVTSAPAVLKFVVR